MSDDPRTAREQLLAKAGTLRQVYEPHKRAAVVALVHERLRIGRIGDLTKEFVCTAAEIISAAYEHLDDYWRLWLDHEAAPTGLAIEHVLAVHAATELFLVTRYQRLLTNNGHLREVLFRASLREGLIALAAEPDYRLLVCPELRAYLAATAAPTVIEAPPAPEIPPPEPPAGAGKREVTRWLKALAAYHLRHGLSTTEVVGVLRHALWDRETTGELDAARKNALRDAHKKRAGRIVKGRRNIPQKS